MINEILDDKDVQIKKLKKMLGAAVEVIESISSPSHLDYRNIDTDFHNKLCQDFLKEYEGEY